VTRGGRERKWPWKWGCGNARGRTLEEGTVSDSWCWWSAASVAAAGGARAVAGAAWRVREKTAERTGAAVYREETHGDCQKQEVVLAGLQRR
jgi:hypothetical protein